MAEGNGSSNTGVIAVLVIFVIVIVLAFLAYRGGMFGGGKGGGATINVDVNTK
jgi:hypothetical protein